MSGLAELKLLEKQAFFSSDELVGAYKDNLGEVEVRLRDGIYKDILFMSSKNSGVQSRINLLDPNVPSLAYIKTMCAASALHSDPRDVLFLGMGGGSLPKYWIDHFPESQKTVVDLRPLMFQVARDHFMFEPDSRTHLVGDDANSFLTKAASMDKKYDIIYVDIYIEGPADIQNNQYFWDAIYKCLNPGGLVCSNIWTSGENERKYFNIKKFHKKIFKTVFKIDSPESYQVALYGTMQPKESVVGVSSGIRAIEQMERTGINFNEILLKYLRLV